MDQNLEEINLAELFYFFKKFVKAQSLVSGSRKHFVKLNVYLFCFVFLIKEGSLIVWLIIIKLEVDNY